MADTTPDAGAPPRPYLELRGLSKRFADVEVLQGLQLTLAEGEILALLGLSGSGKTTALRLVAGFEQPDAGAVVIAGEDVTAEGPAARGFGMVFQHYALFPHMTVADNVAFGLEAQRWSKRAISARVAAMLELVDLAGYGARPVSAISGGQQQRVALARALAPEPRVLLLDEPLSNLDPALRERTRRELRAAVKAIGITTLLVTHEQEEAFHLGDRVAVLHRGRLQQVATPHDLYRRPANRFVATFVGRAGALGGVVEAIRDQVVEVRLEAAAASWSGRTSAALAVGEAVELVARPESLAVVPEGAPAALAGRLLERRFTGAATYGVIELAAGGELEVLLDHAAGPAAGETVHVAPRDGGVAPRVFRREVEPA